VKFLPGVERAWRWLIFLLQFSGQPPGVPMSGYRRRRKSAGVFSPADFAKHVPIRAEVGFLGKHSTSGRGEKAV
jgi:hypothetical protein